MNNLTAGLATLGVAPDRIHTELFGAGPSVTPGIAASPRQPPHLPPVSEACDVPVHWSCRAGVCHCETGLVAGTVNHRPDPVVAPADGNVLICCAHPEGDVVIDL